MCGEKKDAGIWERRHAIEDYVHSKLLCWVAIDRAVKIAQFMKRPAYVEPWTKMANEIKEDILEKGWNESHKCFSMSYGSDDYDAANLLMLHYGFLDNKDERIVSTVNVYYDHLVKNGFCFRYVATDEFGEPENAFIVCTFWMINALFLIGEEQKARAMFKNIQECANHLGLFAEDVQLSDNRLVGNFPQGYSHLAYIQTILLLETDYNWSDTFKEVLNND